MIVVLKLLSGEEIIGKMECQTDEEFYKLESYELFDPMWIVPGESGAMKLRDAVMLAENAALIFNPEFIITCYHPSESLVRYYQCANDYSQRFTRAAINSQIDLATSELQEMIKEEEKYASSLTDTLLKMTNSTLQ